MLTTRPLAAHPAVRFHMMPDGRPHVHERFCAAPHEGCRVVCVCGKGGVGKTVVVACMTRALAADPDASGRLLVIDADPALGLALALGVEPAQTLASVRDELLAAAQSGSGEEEQRVAASLDWMVSEALEEHDGFALLAMGRSRELGCYCSVNDLLRDAVELLARDFDVVLIDGEAGLEQVNRQVVAALDDLVLVSDGSARAARTVETLWDMAAENDLVAPERIHLLYNRLSPLARPAGLRADVTPHVLGTVPEDAALAAADRAARPLLDVPADSPACHAVRHAAERLLAS